MTKSSLICPIPLQLGTRYCSRAITSIRQNPSEGGGGRVLLIYSDQGKHFETSTMTIPTLDTLTPKDTKVVLHRFGNDYFFDKIWIQGKNYGYEFPLPESVKSRERERMQPVNVAARYEAMPAQQAQTTTRNEVAEATPPPAPAPAAPPTANREEPQTTAQATPPPAPARLRLRNLHLLRDGCRIPTPAGYHAAERRAAFCLRLGAAAPGLVVSSK